MSCFQPSSLHGMCRKQAVKLEDVKQGQDFILPFAVEPKSGFHAHCLITSALLMLLTTEANRQ